MSNMSTASIFTVFLDVFDLPLRFIAGGFLFASALRFAALTMAVLRSVDDFYQYVTDYQPRVIIPPFQERHFLRLRLARLDEIQRKIKQM